MLWGFAATNLRNHDRLGRGRSRGHRTERGLLDGAKRANEESARCADGHKIDRARRDQAASVGSSGHLCRCLSARCDGANRERWAFATGSPFSLSPSESCEPSTALVTARACVMRARRGRRMAFHVGAERASLAARIKSAHVASLAAGRRAALLGRRVAVRHRACGPPLPTLAPQPAARARLVGSRQSRTVCAASSPQRPASAGLAATAAR